MDTNALISLVRFRMHLLKKNLTVKDIPALLNTNNTNDELLRNPATGMPFEWDAQRKQVYFVPISEQLRKDYKNIAGEVPGRVGFFLTQ